MGVKSITKESNNAPIQNSTMQQERVENYVQSNTSQLTVEQRKDLLEKRQFSEADVNYLKEEFGIDLYNSKQVNDINFYDIALGRMTTYPLSFNVDSYLKNPVKGENIKIDTIKVHDSVKFGFPYENGKRVAIDNDHKLYFTSVGCLSKIERQTDEQILQGKQEREANRMANQTEYEKSNTELITFTPEEKKALASVGIKGSNLFYSKDSNNYNVYSISQQKAIKNGEKFEINSYISTKNGHSVSVTGIGRLGQDKKTGKTIVDFSPNSLDLRKGEEVVLDIYKCRKVGNVELNFNGDRFNDLNFAGRSLVEFGYSLEPVDGFIHKKVESRMSDGTSKLVDSVSHWKYTVRQLNGNVYIEPMKAINDVTGSPLTRQELADIKSNNDTIKYHYEINTYAIKDNKLIMGTDKKGNLDLCEFSSPQDMENYKRGRVAFVKDATWHSKAEDGTVVTTKQELCVIPNISNNGFPQKFSPETTLKIKEKLNKEQGQKVSQKQERKQTFRI